MAANYNKVLLMGNLTRDPEVRFTPNNQAVANIGLAVNRRWKDANGQPQEETTFVDCEAWGRTAEVMKQYLAKGRPIFIEGRLKLDQWQDKTSGEKRSKLKVVVESFNFIDSKGGPGGPGGPGGGSAEGGEYDQSAPPSQPARGPARAAGGSRAPAAPVEPQMTEDDIPF